MVKTKNRIMFRNETKKHMKKPPHHTNTRKQYGGANVRVARRLLNAAKTKAEELLTEHRKARVIKLKKLVLNDTSNLQKITGRTKKNANDSDARTKTLKALLSNIPIHTQHKRVCNTRRIF